MLNVCPLSIPRPVPRPVRAFCVGLHPFEELHRGQRPEPTPHRSVHTSKILREAKAHMIGDVRLWIGERRVSARSEGQKARCLFLILILKVWHPVFFKSNSTDRLEPVKMSGLGFARDSLVSWSQASLDARQQSMRLREFAEWQIGRLMRNNTHIEETSL